VAPARLAEDWDNPGFQVGSRAHTVSKILFALDATLETVRKACRVGAQMLITHHPLIYKPLTTVNLEVHPGNVIVEAIRGGVSIACAHTNLDVSQGGINDILADLLGLHHVEQLVVAETGAGLGRIGRLPEPISLLDLKARIEGLLGMGDARVMYKGDREIRVVAVVGGAGGGLIAPARERGADVLVTGDVTYHQALEARSLDMAVVDAGHFQTEKAAFQVFAKHFKTSAVRKGWNVDVEVDGDEADPMSSGQTAG
jgi:dinuclear metal center YbgI/SA1388 family protein